MFTRSLSVPGSDWIRNIHAGNSRLGKPQLGIDPAIPKYQRSDSGERTIIAMLHVHLISSSPNNVKLGQKCLFLF